MEDIIRILAPRILILLVGLILIWIGTIMVKRNADPDYYRIVKYIAKWISAIAILLFAIGTIYFLGINSAPSIAPNYIQKNECSKFFENRIENKSDTLKK